ncbi:ammonium transporter [Novosphingobium sp. PhB165]|uniref:ammonium transporter n=1 Tax=Novosphingobium sp. PhB165 TaxID=2485105 RepID=UPI0010479467|nr:ammonium transporter [Novosphingobium sp. PhB165]TCM20408.1 ammonium transporter [Novosphingobium sp. PhB165]
MRKNIAWPLAFAGVSTPTLAHAASAVSNQPNGADTVWILISSALVLMMCMPGLGLFYGGLVRAKNFLAVLVQVGAVAAIASLLWIVCGYTIAFGTVTNGWFGAANALMLSGLPAMRAGLTLPENAYALFEMCFAAITPALMVGAWVDRARFSWVIGFCALWSLVVYAPVAHWIWGGGWLATQWGTLDYAGGIVVHTTAGVSALIVAIMLGKRQGFPKALMLPHSPALTMAGAGLLWVGWFGFNGGSALAGNGTAVNAIINTHIAASAAAISWLLIERITLGKPTSVGFATGAIAGLATVTPAAGFIAPGAALLFGVVGAGICFPMILLVKHKWEIDDSLDVFAVHGVGGMAGSLLLGVFLSSGLGGVGYAEGMSGARQLVAQLLGVSVVALWSAVATVAIGLSLARVLPMRVSEDEEVDGLDLSSHGERAWELD